MLIQLNNAKLFVLNVTICASAFICVDSDYYIIRKANTSQIKLTTSALENNQCFVKVLQ